MTGPRRTAHGIVVLCLLLWLGQATAVEHPYLHDAGDHCVLCPLSIQGGHALPAGAPIVPRTRPFMPRARRDVTAHVAATPRRWRARAPPHRL